MSSTLLFCYLLDVNIRSNRGVSALMLASVKGNWDVVKCLTRYEADIHVENNDKSDNALTMACLGNNTPYSYPSPNTLPSLPTHTTMLTHFLITLMACLLRG